MVIVPFHCFDGYDLLIRVEVFMRNVAIDHGWCRALRTGSTPRPEMRRDWGQG